ncbi:hypothetical protein DPMN_059645 [Dreissena polymorpha]|uniref:Uncharacterized protein n=1 Tax=Dreissena polymorpha TaxID=45954 RepID=A0A9D4C4A3_DREPO|nr:hypothetical protein DPMN_059605 [Dreissena polymorpha]KAH3716912.1 hypothetical protein DPMN_059645 [Dreissena polymorpha]
MSSSTGCWFVFLHNSSLEILSGQRILRIFLRQVLMKTCIFFMVVTVVLQVSAPLRRSGFTMVLKSLILVVMLITLDPQMFFS